MSMDVSSSKKKSDAFQSFSCGVTLLINMCDTTQSYVRIRRGHRAHLCRSHEKWCRPVLFLWCDVTHSICDMTHSYKRICPCPVCDVTHSICDMTHSYKRICPCPGHRAHLCRKGCESHEKWCFQVFSRDVTLLINMCDITQLHVKNLPRTQSASSKRKVRVPRKVMPSSLPPASWLIRICQYMYIQTWLNKSCHTCESMHRDATYVTWLIGYVFEE